MFRKQLFPSFIVIGAQKAGTSSIYNTLRHHPQLLPPTVKETHFFDHEAQFNKGKQAYARYFSSVNRFSSKKTFEITPSYIFHPKVAGRIKSMLPSVKLIVILRDPTRRAFSAWNMFHSFKDDAVYGHRYDPRGFEQAIADELNGKSNIYNYISRGYYARQLAYYFELFAREDMLVLNYVELKNNRPALFQKICSFVGIDEFSGKEVHFNARSNVRAYGSEMENATALQLNEHFAPHLEELNDLLGSAFDLVERNIPSK